MARLWVLLFFVWYHVINIAKTESTKANYFLSEDNSIDKSLEDSYTQKVAQSHTINNKQESDNENESNRVKRSFENQQEANNENENNHAVPTLNPGKTINKCLHPLIKRKFNSWGGKRVPYSNNELSNNLMYDCLVFLKENPDIFNNEIFDDDEIFDSRNKMNFPDDQMPPKRLPFNAWGGKREIIAESLAPKRLPFRAWGGKRSPEEFAYPIYPINIDAEIGRFAKLASPVYDPAFSQKRINRKKTKFHSWGGKRSFDDSIATQEANEPWNEDDEYPTIEDIKRTFHSWGGKRNIGV